MTKILIADDNEQNRYMLQVLLKGNGYDVVSATNGAEALEMARGDPPDMIVTDILMPVMDGFTLCRHWKEDERLKNIPFIFYTATYTEPEDEKLALSLGADRFLIKPIELGMLVQILTEVFEEYAAKESTIAPKSAMEEGAYYQEYNEALFRKLERKMAQLEEANQRLSALYQASVAITSIMDLSKLLPQVLDITINILGYTQANFFLYDTAAKVFHLAVSAGCFQDVKAIDQALTFALGDERGLVGLVGQTKDPLIVQDTSRDERWIPFDETVRSALFVPVVYEETALGVMVFLSTKTDAFTEQDAQNGMTLAGGVAIAIRNARLYEQAQQEIAERTQAEAALLKSQARLTEAQRIARLGNWEWDIINNTIIWSDEVYRIFGLEPLQLEGTFEGFLKRAHPDDREFVNRSVQEALSNHKILRIDHRVVLPDGEGRVVYEQGEVILDEMGQAIGMVGTVQDITERRQLEEQLRQAQKMEAIGRLAGGVAHDFNNLLTVIIGSSELLLLRHANNDKLKRGVKLIMDASERATALTRQLLAFSRQQILQPKTLNLNGVIADIEKMLPRLIGEDIDLVVVPGPELGLIRADQGQLEQVIMNLAVNARDAMPQGGKLTIETSNIYLDEGYAQHHLAVTPGPYVMLTVSDTGIGMNPDVQARIFEPFFTTKEMGKGTGLGLATVHGIVNQSGGHIWVYSEPNEGSTFKIYLPQVKQARAELDQQKQPEVATLLGSETILLVEDDKMVRDLICQTLTGYGYTVLEASDGREAMAVCQQRTGTIHLLLTDVIMPGGMNGSELAEQLALLSPQIKVLYISGYPGEAIAHHSNLVVSNTSFISKPFSPTILGQKVREVLDSKTHKSSRD